MHADCVAATQRPHASRAVPLPVSHARLSTRQGAYAFNQPLSFDTSSVRDMSNMEIGMGNMFLVRSACALAPTASSRALSPCACPLASPSPHAPSTRTDSRQNTNSLSAANKLLIRCAWAGNSAFASAGYGPSWAPGTCA